MQPILVTKMVLLLGFMTVSGFGLCCLCLSYSLGFRMLFTEQRFKMQKTVHGDGVNLRERSSNWFANTNAVFLFMGVGSLRLLATIPDDCTPALPVSVKIDCITDMQHAQDQGSQEKMGDVLNRAQTGQIDFFWDVVSFCFWHVSMARCWVAMLG